MIGSTNRSVLVTRYSYLREVDPRTILHTGLTRDGNFLIEQGRITRTIRFWRINESPLIMMNDLEMLGSAELIAGVESAGAIVMSAIRV